MGKGGENEEEDGEPRKVDERFELLRERIESSLKPKNPKAFGEMLLVDSNKVMNCSSSNFPREIWEGE